MKNNGKRLLATAIIIPITYGITSPAAMAETLTANNNSTVSEENAPVNKTKINLDSAMEKKTVVETEKIPFNTRVIKDDTLPEGVTIVVNNGAEGTKEKYVSTTHTTKVDGSQGIVEINHEKTTILPKERVIREGTAKNTVKTVDAKIIQQETEKKIEEANKRKEEQRKKEAAIKAAKEARIAKAKAEKEAKEKAAAQARAKKAAEEKAERQQRIAAQAAKERQQKAAAAAKEKAAKDARKKASTTRATYSAPAKKKVAPVQRQSYVQPAPKTSAPSSSYGGMSPSQAKAWAKQYMAATYGWGEGEYQALVTLWNRESGWNYKAANPRSSARGIPQAMMSIAFGGYGSASAQEFLNNASVQIKWGLNYIKGRYGTPSNALAHSYSKGWY